MNQYEQTMLDNARAEYADSLDEYGVIRSPGKFEGEHVSAVALWAIGCEGFADVDSTDCDGTPYYEFFFSRSELADYGLESHASDDIDSYYVVLVESDSGFVFMSVNTSPVGDDCDDSDYDNDPTPEPEPVQKRRKTRKPHEIEGLLISETFINLDKGWRFGESEPYEPFTENIGKLFRSLQREYGRCTGKVYIDTSSGTKAIRWIFEKRMQYDDARSKNDTYTRQVWVTLHTAKPTRSITYQHATLD